MNKKIIILLLLFVLLIATFLLVIYFKIDLKPKKEPVIVEDITEKKLDVKNLLLNIVQNKDGLLLDFKTEDKYSCGDLTYEFKVNKEQGLIRLDLKNITEKLSCTAKPRLIEKSETIGEIKNWTLDIYYENRNFKYQIISENNSIKISNINNSQDESVFKFEKQSYVVLAKNIVRLRIDYYDAKAETGVNNLLKRLNVASREIAVKEAELAFTNLTSVAYKSNAKYSIVKYFSFEDENIFKSIVLEFKKIDCYKDNPDYKNCISLDFRTSTGKRYCTWLNVNY